MASDLQTRRTEIESAFETAWAGRTPIAWEGHDDPAIPPEPPAPWIRLTIRWGEAAIDTIRGPVGVQNRIPGVLFVNVFGPPGRGMKEVEDLADDVRDVVNLVVVQGVRFGASSGPQAPTTDREGWFQTVVKTGFEVRETV